MPAPTTESGRRERPLPIIGQLLVIVTIVAVRCLGLSDRAESELTIASWLYVLLAGWHLYTWKRASGVLLDPYGIFLIAATLFNGGQTLLQIFHASEGGMLDGEFSDEQLLAVLFYVGLGLAFMQLGALLAVRSAGRAPARPRTAITNQDIRHVGWALLIVSAPFSILVLGEALSIVLSSGYMGLYQTEAATGADAAPRMLAGLLVPAAIFLLAGSEPSRPAVARVAVAVIAINAAIEMFLGRRYHAAMPLVAFAWLWHVRVRPIPRWVTLGGGAFAMFVIFPLVASTRGAIGSDRLSLPMLADAFGDIDNVFVAIIKELGNTMVVLAHTVALVPSERGFDWGMSYVYAALRLMPNLFGDLQPSAAAGMPSDWLVWSVDPVQAALGGGLGYSFLAEGYLNFGWPGVPAVGFVVGYAYARLNQWGKNGNDAARLAALATVAVFLTFFARAESAVVLRAVIYRGLLPYWGLRVWARHRVGERLSGRLGISS